MGNIRIQQVICRNQCFRLGQNNVRIADLHRVAFLRAFDQFCLSFLPGQLLRFRLGDGLLPGEIEDVHSVAAVDHRGISRLTCRIKAPVANLPGELSLLHTPVGAAIQCGGGILRIPVGQIREGTLHVFFLLGQRFYPGGSLLPEGRHSLLCRDALCFKQNMPEIDRILPGRIPFHLRLRQIIGQLGKVHIRPVQFLRHFCQGLFVGAKGLPGQGTGVDAALLPCQRVQGVSQRVQVCLVHGIGRVIGIVAVQIRRCRHTFHIFLIEMVGRLIGLLGFHGNIRTLLVQRRRCVPAIERLTQKKLLPTGYGIIRATTLDVQRQAKIRPALRIGLAVLCRRGPIPDSQLSIGQSFLPHPGNDRVFAPLSGVAALAGHVRGISVRRHRPDRHRFLRRRGLGRCLRRVSAAA